MSRAAIEISAGREAAVEFSRVQGELDRLNSFIRDSRELLATYPNAESGSGSATIVAATTEYEVATVTIDLRRGRRVKLSLDGVLTNGDDTTTAEPQGVTLKVTANGETVREVTVDAESTIAGAGLLSLPVAMAALDKQPGTGRVLYRATIEQATGSVPDTSGATLAATLIAVES